MSQLSAMDRVLNMGGRYNPSALIFGDFLSCDKKLTEVSRAFRNANHKALVRVGDEILLRSRVTFALEPEAAEERLPVLFGDVSRKIEEMAAVPRFSSITLGATWSGFLETYSHWIEERNPEHRRLRISLLIEHLEDVNRNLDILLADARRNLPTDRAYHQIYKGLEEVLFRDRLARRFEEVARVKQLVPHNIEQITACFSGLYESQNASLKRANPLRPPLPEPDLCTLRHFRDIEDAVFTAEYLEQDQGLVCLWGAVRNQINAGPPRDIDKASSIRAWMNNPANFALLAQPELLNVRIRGQIPPEIGRLTGLRELTIRGDGGVNAQSPAFLPAEFGNLQRLEVLSFDRVALSEIPPVLETLPALEYLGFTDQLLPIARFPDALERQINSGLRNFYLLFNNESAHAYRLLAFLGLNHHLNQGQWSTHFNRPYAGLNYHQMTEIPFRVYFRENFSIPNLPFALNTWLIEITGSWMDALERSCGWSLAVAVAIPTLILLHLPLLLLSIPFYLINFVLNQGIEPIVTLIRDLFGYSRMVQITERSAELPPYDIRDGIEDAGRE